MNPWSRGKHTWLWIGRSGFESRWEQIFSNFFSYFWLFEKLWKTLIQCQFQNGVCHFCKISESWKNGNTELRDKMKKNCRQPDLNRGPKELKSATLSTQPRLNTKINAFSLCVSSFLRVSDQNPLRHKIAWKITGIR